MNIKGLRAFTQIMATGTLSAAAKGMNISVSALSRQLSLLEAELGLTLFARENQRLNPTEEGEAFHREANRLLHSIEQIPDIVREIQHGSRRRMRAIISPRMAHAIAVPAISDFIRERSDVEVSVEVQPMFLLERWVASQQFDFGLGALPACHAAIETEKICSMPPVVIMHPGHRLASRTTITVEELADEHLLLLPSTTAIGRQVARILEDAEVVPKSRTLVSQTQICCDFAAQGAGISVTDPMIPHIFGSRLKLVPLDTAVRLDFGLLFQRNADRSKEIKRIVEIVKYHAETFMHGLNFH